MTTAPLHILAHCRTRTRTLAPLVIFASFTLSCTEQPPEKPALPKIEQCEDAWKSTVSFFGGPRPSGRCRGAWGYNGSLYFVTGGGKLVSRPKLSPFVEHQSQVWSIHPEGDSLMVLQDNEDPARGQPLTKLILSTVSADNPSEQRSSIDLKVTARLSQGLYQRGPVVFRSDALFVGVQHTDRFTFSRFDLATKTEEVLVNLDWQKFRGVPVQAVGDFFFFPGRDPVVVKDDGSGLSRLALPSILKASAVAASAQGEVLWWGEQQDESDERSSVFATSRLGDSTPATLHVAPFLRSKSLQAWASAEGGWFVVGQEQFEYGIGTSLWHFDNAFVSKRLACTGDHGSDVINVQRDEGGMYLGQLDDYGCGVSYVAF